MRRILPILILVAALLTGAFILSDPVYRYPVVGVQLSRSLEALKGKDAITMQVSLETGTDVIQEDDLGSEPAVQDTFNLLMILSEEVQPKSESASVVYKVGEMQSEQWAWKKAELNKLQARTEVTSRHTATTPSMTVPKPHELAEADVWGPFVASLWPKLPDGFLKAGKASWTDQFSYSEKSPIGGDPVKVNLQLAYRLENFVNTDAGVYANVVMLGTLSAASGQDPSLKVSGTYKGFCLIDPETGRVSSGEYRLEQQMMVKNPGLPVVRTTTFQGVRFWRPKFHKAAAAPAPGVAPAATPGATAEASQS